MESLSLTTLAAEKIAEARDSRAGRAATTVHGGHAHGLRQTLVALRGGEELAEHDSPGEATLQVLTGRVALTVGESTWEGAAGDYVTIPPQRHGLTAFEDSAVLLTVALSAKHPE
ncbi:cupin domain-containing protein [Mycolicibacillus parakoreensis]|uniref:Cupin domain-containing protein n=1 Tax=Mycolicibacillus parakoreensis TaxID=1069221 RepID=A0ABY3TX94_9MYCO|nr:cupin domain-containing protein [Mycolicibacillus parakoreensis]MCV7317182.1 cupin domain-containing protein [Mycolicibacillus parakoreensis]ULN51499.1 cupin domain-containing protein [Mycolicibacillus parakoreensis]